jgi:hypothetical protein
VPLPVRRPFLQARRGDGLCPAVAKGTISKAIKTGKLSATRREDGSWSIDNAELARYLDANGHRFRSETGAADQPETGVETNAATDALIGETLLQRAALSAIATGGLLMKKLLLAVAALLVATSANARPFYKWQCGEYVVTLHGSTMMAPDEKRYESMAFKPKLPEDRRGRISIIFSWSGPVDKEVKAAEDYEGEWGVYTGGKAFLNGKRCKDYQPKTSMEEAPIPACQRQGTC